MLSQALGAAERGHFVVPHAFPVMHRLRSSPCLREGCPHFVRRLARSRSSLNEFNGTRLRELRELRELPLLYLLAGAGSDCLKSCAFMIQTLLGSTDAAVYSLLRP